MTTICSLMMNIYNSLNFFFSLQKLVLFKCFFFPDDLVLAFHTRCFLPYIRVILGDMLIRGSGTKKTMISSCTLWPSLQDDLPGPFLCAITMRMSLVQAFALGLFRVPREDTAQLLPGRHKPYLQNSISTISNSHLTLIFT